MKEKDAELTRKKFLLAGSAAVASPLIMGAANSIGAGKTAEARTTKTKTGFAAKGTKIYYIRDGCVGCQVCKTYCPAQAIRFGDCKNEIDQTKCIHCGTCYRGCNISVISETILS